MFILFPLVLKKASTGLPHRKRGNVLSPLHAPPSPFIRNPSFLEMAVCTAVLADTGNCSTFEKYITSLCPHSKGVMNAKQVSQPFVLRTRCFSFFSFFGRWHAKTHPGIHPVCKHFRVLRTGRDIFYEWVSQFSLTIQERLASV